MSLLRIVLASLLLAGTAWAQPTDPPPLPTPRDFPAPLPPVLVMPGEFPAPPPVMMPGGVAAPVPPMFPMQAPGAPQTPPPPAQRPPSRPTPAAAPPADPTKQQPGQQPARKARGRDLNLLVELTISDQVGTATPEKKVVSMLAADATFGRIRSGSHPGAPDSPLLNVDARPQVMEDERILLELTVEYRPALPEGAPPGRRPAPMNESLTVILQNGKPMTVSQAADPITDRKVTVEVKASVVK